MLRRPPTAPLFPYTTLFRSAAEHLPTVLARHERRHAQARPVQHRVGRHRRVARGAEPAEVDRKSTRLNSSHTVTSYAVFCLKKKKPQIRDDPGQTCARAVGA